MIAIKLISFDFIIINKMKHVHKNIIFLCLGVICIIILRIRSREVCYVRIE